jgi:CelD/BcsL family acetyltransferase involved in cellulose biosynthesis
MWYKPSFAIELARFSPGEVLLRQLLLRAIEEGLAIFDFGLGEEPFKARFATHSRQVRNWGLYPAGAPLPDY